MGEDRLRILRVVQSTYPEVVGGVGLHVHNMSKVQAEMGHDVTVLTTDNGDRSLPSKEKRSGYELIRHRELLRPLDNSIAPGVLHSLGKLATEHDVVHVHSHLYFMSNLAAIYEVFDKTPMVLTNHGLVSQTAPLSVQKLFLPTVGRLTFEAADRVLCYTETDKERLRERGIDSKIAVIPNGIDCDQFAPNYDRKKRKLLFVGRLKKGKGPHHLIEAFSAVTCDYPELELTIVGDGPMRGELELRASDLGIESLVTFEGEVPNDELPDLYNQHLGFVLPSLSEGLPRTVLEAMATGTPVVTSDLDQLEPVVENVGFTTKPGSPGDLEASLRDLIELSSSERQKLGESARQKIEQNYSWRNTVEMTVDVYRTVIEESSGSTNGSEHDSQQAGSSTSRSVS